MNSLGEAKWHRLLARASSFRDIGGQPLDAGIRETVAALWANGFRTRWSCAGHARVFPNSPWVTISATVPDSLFPQPVLRILAREERNRLLELVGLFQEEAGYPEEDSLRLGLEPYPYIFGGVRYENCAYQLRSSEAVWWGRTESDRLARLPETTAEMRRFTVWLRSRFLLPRHAVA